MYDYLVYNGVPQSQMILENVSTSTVENIAYSKLLIERMGGSIEATYMEKKLTIHIWL